MRPGIICTHVAIEGHAALSVMSGEAMHDNDSGWSVGCGAGPHGDDELMVVDLDPYLAQDSELQQLGVTLAEGWMATREAPGDPWVQAPIPPDEDDQEAA